MGNCLYKASSGNISFTRHANQLRYRFSDDVLESERTICGGFSGTSDDILGPDGVSRGGQSNMVGRREWPRVSSRRLAAA